MSVGSEIYGNVGVVRVEEELTADSVARFKSQVEALLAEGVKNLVLNMERTEYVDSAGLEALLDVMEQVEGRGGEVKFCAVGQTCMKIFEITRLERFVKNYDNLLDAVRSFAETY